MRAARMDSGGAGGGALRLRGRAEGAGLPAAARLERANAQKHLGLAAADTQRARGYQRQAKALEPVGRMLAHLDEGQPCARAAMADDTVLVLVLEAL